MEGRKGLGKGREGREGKGRKGREGKERVRPVISMERVKRGSKEAWAFTRKLNMQDGAT